MMFNPKRYVIIGNSAAGLAALETLRKYDRVSNITLISREKGPAYSLVLLPHFIGNKIDKHRLLIADREYYRRLNAKRLFQKTVVEIQAERQEVLLHDGLKIPYDNLIICSGAKPNPFNVTGGDVVTMKPLRTLQDAIEIKHLLQNVKKLLVVGAGLINMKLVSVIKREDLEITVVEMAGKVLPNLLDNPAAAIVENKMLKTGIHLYKSTFLSEIKNDSSGNHIAVLANGHKLTAEAIIVNTGITPNTAFATSSGLKVNRGIIIDDYARTNIPNIYAAGDVVEAKEKLSGQYVTIGNWFNAVEQGKTAALSSLGNHRKYEGPINTNITDLFGLTIASIGNVSTTPEGSKSLQFSDFERNQYQRIIINDERIIGGVFINEKKTAGIFRSLLGEQLADTRLTALKKYEGSISFGQMMSYSKKKKR